MESVGKSNIWSVSHVVGYIRDVRLVRKHNITAYSICLSQSYFKISIRSRVVSDIRTLLLFQLKTKIGLDSLYYWLLERSKLFFGSFFLNFVKFFFWGFTFILIVTQEIMSLTLAFSKAWLKIICYQSIFTNPALHVSPLGEKSGHRIRCIQECFLLNLLEV